MQRAVPASAAMSACERNSTATALAGQGLMGVARDSHPRNGNTMSFCAAFAEVEVGGETRMYQVTDFLCVARRFSTF